MTIHDACDVIITRICEGGASMNLLKLQKLLYYAQAWHLAFYDDVLFEGKFQAWIQGPTNKDILNDRFQGRSLYSEVDVSDVREGFDEGDLEREDVEHIEDVLEVYGGYSSTQLESLTHGETPWIDSRTGHKGGRYTSEIPETLMRDYYRNRIENEDT